MFAPDSIADLPALRGPVALVLIVTAGAALTALALALIAWRADRRRADEARRDADRQRRWRAATDAAGAGIAFLRAEHDDDGLIRDFRIADADAAAARLVRRSAETLVGERFSTLGCPADAPLFRLLVDALVTGVPAESELRADPRRAATSWLHVRAVPVADGLAIAVRDIREEKRRAAALERASTRDPLTGLHNRRGFETLAEQQLRHVQRSGRDAVLLYLDLDGFKPVNDTHGHAAGDRALRRVARLLRDCVRDSDIVARLGGDEFAILAIDADVGTVPAIEARLDRALADAHAAGDLPAALGVSAGHVRVTRGDRRPLETLLDAADAALYVRKRARRAARRAMASITATPPEPAAASATGAPFRAAPRLVPVEAAALRLAIAAAHERVRGDAARSHPPFPPARYVPVV